MSVNLALVYEQPKFSMEDLAEADGNRVQAGAAIRATSGGASFAAGNGIGYANFDMKRAAGIGAFGGVADADQVMGHVSGRVRASYDWGDVDNHIRLGTDIAMIAMPQRGFDESGAGLANLQIEDHTGFNVPVAPFIEAAATIGTAWDDVTFRPWARIGLTQYLESDTRVFAELQAAPGQADPFYSDAGFDQTL